MVRVRGAELAVESSGDGPTLLWGHGFSSSMATEATTPMIAWDRVTADHRVVRWDARGHGRSTGTDDPESYRWESLALDALAIAAELGVDSFACGGVSMGAATALHVAAVAADRVTALVLVLPPTAYDSRPAQAEQYRAGAERIERDGIDAYVEHVNAQPTPEILRAFAAGFRYVPAVDRRWFPAALRGAAASDLPDPDVVAAIAASTLILAWDTDPGHPRSTAERLAELLPSAELHIATRLRDVAGWTDLVQAFLGQGQTTTPGAKSPSS